MFIIGGKYGGRKIKTILNNTYRPTTFKVKESIFSILRSGQFLDDNGKSVLDDAVTVDVFGGTGALTFEAISRGAKKGYIIEKDHAHLKTLKENIEKLNFEESIIALQGNACDLMKAKEQCDIAFIDPPFNEGLITDTIQSLVQKDWLKEGGLIVIERHINDLYNPGKFCNLLFQRKYGKVFLEILQKSEN